MTTLVVAARRVVTVVTGLAALAAGGCAERIQAPPAPLTSTSTVVVPSPAPVVVQPPSTVYVEPPRTETVVVPAPRSNPQTPCQLMYAKGYSYAAAVSEWLRSGSPINWDADKDGYPCEQSYGERN